MDRIRQWRFVGFITQLPERSKAAFPYRFREPWRNKPD